MKQHPKLSKGSETPTPPMAEMGGVEEASEKEQCERQRDNATIELAGLIGKPFGRVRRREILLLDLHYIIWRILRQIPFITAW